MTPARGGRAGAGTTKAGSPRNNDLAWVRSAAKAEKHHGCPVDDSARFSVTLPYPPSVNHLWRRVGNKTLLSAEGRAYRERVGALVKVQSQVVPRPPHHVTVVATVPDRRRRDIDNLLKGLLDPVYAALGVDDSVIVRLEIEKRGPDAEGARVAMTIRTAPPPLARGPRGTVGDD